MEKESEALGNGIRVLVSGGSVLASAVVTFAAGYLRSVFAVSSGCALGESES